MSRPQAIDVNLTIHPPLDPPKPPSEHIAQLPLKECVGSGKSANTSVSVLDGVVRVERADDEVHSFRIVANFQLQVKIHGFEKGYFKTHNRLFDFISLRYLYKADEIHEILPNFDEQLATEAEVTEESTKSSNMGLSMPAAAPAVAPSLSVQVGRDQKLTVKRTMAAWRPGLCYESWHPRRSKGLIHAGEYHGEERTQRPGRHQKKHKAFQVQSKHRKNPDCECEDPFDFENCEFRESNFYSCCAHWFWQVSAQPHFWTPEIYESVTFLITVTRIVDPKRLETKSRKAGQQYFHFDFVLKTRLRELGWLVRDHFPSWRPRKPAEIRAKDDYGYPLGVEKIKICVRACPEAIDSWPQKPTRILQAEAEERVSYLS
jgi:hypothetical protein